MTAGDNDRPSYLHGKTGVVIRPLGPVWDPQQCVCCGDGLPPRSLYRVMIRQHELWPDYAGSPEDGAVLDIVRPWRGPA